MGLSCCPHGPRSAPGGRWPKNNYIYIRREIFPLKIRASALSGAPSGMSGRSWEGRRGCWTRSALTQGQRARGTAGPSGRPGLPRGLCLPTSRPCLVACSRVPEPSRLHDGAGDRPGRPARPRQLPQVTTPRLPRDPRRPQHPAATRGRAWRALFLRPAPPLPAPHPLPETPWLSAVDLAAGRQQNGCQGIDFWRSCLEWPGGTVTDGLNF